MADSLKHNSTLKSFNFNASMADALKHNSPLESFNFPVPYLSTDDDKLEAAIEGTLNAHVSFRSVNFSSMHFSGITQRNKVLRKQRHTLAGIARRSDDFSFKSLTERSFRREIFTFFLPSDCKWMP